MFPFLIRPSTYGQGCEATIPFGGGGIFHTPGYLIVFFLCVHLIHTFVYVTFYCEEFRQNWYFLQKFNHDIIKDPPSILEAPATVPYRLSVLPVIERHSMTSARTWTWTWTLAGDSLTHSPNLRYFVGEIRISSHVDFHSHQRPAVTAEFPRHHTHIDAFMLWLTRHIYQWKIHTTLR